MSIIITDAHRPTGYTVPAPPPGGRSALDALKALGLREACDEAVREHHQRVAEERPYEHGVTSEELRERIATLRGER